MVIVGGAVSGCGVITRMTLHMLASKPAAMTRRTTSLLVKMPAILGWAPGVVVGSMTQTAVVRRSRMRRATSRTVALGPTTAGWVPESMTDVRSGKAVFSRKAST